MKKYKRKAARSLIGITVMLVILMLIISIASILTEKGTFTEEMTIPIICLGIFIAGLIGSIILTKKKQNGIIRGFIIGLLLFGVPFMIGKTTSIETIETHKGLTILVFAEIGTICGAVISNKKRRYKRA